VARSESPTAALTIRIAVPPDASRLAELSAELGYPASSTEITGRLERLLDRENETVLVCALPSGQVVGWLHASEQELLESGRRCEILGLVVDSEHRSRGVGRRLVLAVEQWAAGRGIEQMAVRSNVARAESHPFYQRLGYVRAKTQHAYRKRLPTSEQRPR